MFANKASVTRLCLFDEINLTTVASVPLNRDQSHYLKNMIGKGESNRLPGVRVNYSISRARAPS
jgi:hypothetical protein